MRAGLVGLSWLLQFSSLLLPSASAPAHHLHGTQGGVFDLGLGWSLAGGGLTPRGKERRVQWVVYSAPCALALAAPDLKPHWPFVPCGLLWSFLPLSLHAVWKRRASLLGTSGYHTISYSFLHLPHCYNTLFIKTSLINQLDDAICFLLESWLIQR